jgi:S1-C subfamily serine protease
MQLDIEALTDAALVAIIADDDRVLGTGFVIDEYGTVLTCHHVVDGLTSVRLHATDGSIREASEAAFAFAPEIDLVLIRTYSVFGIPLPVASKAVSATTYWTKGYHGAEKVIRAAFPVQGRIIGSTSVSYRSKKTNYNIDDVLVLRDDSIDPGLSGAPVLDPEAGVVIAVVSTKFVHDSWNGGFAVPISHAARSIVLADAVKKNQASVPAFGAYLNAPAARTLCKAVTDLEIENLAQLRNVDPSRHVPRAGVAVAIGRFLSDGTPIFALTGPSGVGKSTEVAALARQLPGRALLLRGSSLHRDSTGGLSEAIRAALTDARGNWPLPDNAGGAIARALSADLGLIVLFDGLNEAPLSGQAFKEWIANTRSWLRNTPAQLIISCRSELWNDLIGPSLSAPLDGREPVVVALGAFTVEEYREAAHVYGLSADTNWPILRLPLALGLSTHYQKRSAQTLRALTSINEVIRAYIEEAARNLAASGTGPPLSARLMLDRLIEIAALMWERGNDAVDIRSFGEIFGTTAIVDALVAEGVMSSTPSGFRFVYDDVGDWLQAQRLDVDSELAAILADRHGSWRRIGPVASALRDIGGSHDSDALRARLAWLVENPGDASDLAFRIAAVTLAKIADTEPYGDVLDRMAEITITRACSFDLYFLSSEATEFWRSISVPLVQRLGLLRRLCLCENYYPWRPKDWARWGEWDNDSTAVKGNYAVLAYNLVRQEPAAGIPGLMPWLDDTTMLAGDWEAALESGSVLELGEATVADVAMCILYQLRTVQERLVWAAMIAAGERCYTLVHQLADDDPLFLARMISNEPNTDGSDKLVIFAADAIFPAHERGRAIPPPEIMQAVYHAVANRYSRGLDRQSLGLALNVLIRGADGQKYVQAVVASYQANVPGVTEQTLAMAAAKGSGEMVVPIFAEALARGGDSKERTLRALANSTDQRARALGDQIVRHYLENGIGDVDRDVSRYAEARISGGDLDEDVLNVIQRVIDAPAGSGREVLAYPLTNFDQPGDYVQRLPLLRKFVEATTDSKSATLTTEMLIRGIVEGGSFPEAFELLQQVLGRLGGSEADRVLIREAFNHERFADTLASWLTTKKLSAPDGYIRQFQERIESGVRPATAAEEVVHQIYRHRND